MSSDEEEEGQAETFEEPIHSGPPFKATAAHPPRSTIPSRWASETASPFSARELFELPPVAASETKQCALAYKSPAPG